MGKQDQPHGRTPQHERTERTPTFLEWVAVAIITFAIIAAAVLLVRGEFHAQDLLALSTALFAGLSGMAALAARSQDRKATDAETQGGEVVDDARSDAHGRPAAEGGDA